MRGALVALLMFAIGACGDDTADAPLDASADGPPPPPACPTDPPAGAPADQTMPGTSAAPAPTIRALAIEWAITGDANTNATVAVRYRVQGAMDWKQGFPLKRIPAGTAEGFSWANRFAGSVFDLEPATTYEIELALLDPDGGCEVRTLTAATRAIPAPLAGATVKPVTSGTFTQVAAAAVPGDILELAAGTYAGFTFTRDGAPGMPIVIRAAAGARVEVTGDIRLDGRHDLIVEGLAVTGKLKFNDSKRLAIVKNTVTTTEDGITTKTRSEDLYIADNVVTGATMWNEAALGASGANIGEGIEVTGPGHVIEHNRVSHFRDCISTIEDSNAVDQYSIDIAYNDLSECADDGIETDFCFHDCRLVGNRLTNVFMGISSQPGLGGPTYFIRNAMFNVLLSPFKLQRGSVGDIALHNTIVKRGDAFGIFTTETFSRQYLRNNLFLGGPGGTYNGYDIGAGQVISLDAADTQTIDLDHDGYGGPMFSGRIGPVRFGNLAELRAMTTEKHAVEITAAAFAMPPAIPASPFPALPPPDLRLATSGAATVASAPTSDALRLLFTAPTMPPWRLRLNRPPRPVRR
jgi:hypothetical protein